MVVIASWAERAVYPGNYCAGIHEVLRIRIGTTGVRAKLNHYSPGKSTLMNFSLTTFVVEINSVPTIVFQAKWQADAERISHEWIDYHWEGLAEKGPRGLDVPPTSKLRFARSSERSAYETDDGNVEFFAGLKFVKLVKRVEEAKSLPDSLPEAHPDNDEQ
jgi:hypothetical protein